MIQLSHHFALQGKENRQNMRAYYTVDPMNTLSVPVQRHKLLKIKEF